MKSQTFDGRMQRLAALLGDIRVVPVLVIDETQHAVPIARALLAGGLPAIEVTLRTEAALPGIRAICEAVPDAVVGAGTVLNRQHVQLAVDAGAQFIVSPGLCEEVVVASQALGVPVIPGVATATETQAAWNLGLRFLKFFPAGSAGGLSMLSALASVFRDIRFVPTGGITPANLRETLDIDAVLACGGSWLTPADAIAAGDFDRIGALAAEAVRISRN